MTFSSVPFLFYFLPLALGAYFVSPWRNAALLAASLIFYAWGEPVLVLALLGSILVNHVLAQRIAVRRESWLLGIGIGANLALLGAFKYAAFLAAPVAGILNVDVSALADIRLPIGISFYTFQSISLLIDLWRRDAPAPRRFVDTALYIAMFPQLIAGPIVRYKSIADQLVSREHSIGRMADGITIFLQGLAQKVLLANLLAETADAAFGQVGQGGLTVAAAWVGLAAYTLQIFFDFAGYSNMAIGLGRLFGFELPRNFNFPYVSKSVTEFWRRWHITLSNWFRDYLYIPLGGNRVGRLRNAANLWIVFLLCGLWHGAAWAFVFWGALHGLFLVIERAFLGRWLARAPSVVAHAYLLLMVSLAWVPFRTEDVGGAMVYYGYLFGVSDAQAVRLGVDTLVSPGMLAILAIGAVAAMWPLVGKALPVLSEQKIPVKAFSVRLLIVRGGLAAGFVLCAIAIIGGSYNPFIYFRF